ncbi:GGDEF domain-containing protein [Vibrio sinaloensis]|uniref:GGDEF domain-containing protein n=1 Tax=Photobacterium sp. (strain ATCC 43367) TaxID=379097 RepID=UPI0022AF0D15|nr:GGDEF domain-containing protein [Vibrio sinaloensis]MCZ4292621.1 GGDEF domain-containing protein [Vibrio sinaloensis]
MGKTLPNLNDEAILDLAKQKQVLKIIAVITLVTFVPLGIKNIVAGEVMLGVVLLAFEVSLLLEITAIVYNRSTLFGHYLPLFLLIFSAVLSVRVFGTLATYWIYPILISLIFLLPEREAIVSNFIMITGSGFAALMHQDAAVTLRYVISLTVTAIIVHVVVQAIRALQLELRTLLVRDSLTGVYNRHELNASLENAIAQYPCSSISLIDVDKFKYFNDQFGHDVGDRILVSIVASLQQEVSPTDKLFRLGGDEFLILHYGKDQILAEETSQRILNKVRQLPSPSDQAITISVGIAECRPFEENKEWIKRADLALYQSKRHGRNRMTSYRDAMADDVERSGGKRQRGNAS